MRLIDLSLTLGRVNVPVVLLIAGAGVAAAVIVQRTLLRDRKESWSRVNDRLFGALLVGFLVWKLTPLFTRFPEIAESPLRLIWYAGGTAGIVAGVSAALLAVAARAWLGSSEPSFRTLLLHGLVVIAGPLLFIAAGFFIVIESGTELGNRSMRFLDGHETTVSETNPVVLVYWATWCGPCTAQMPEVQRAAERLEGAAHVIAVNMRYTESGIDVVRDYLESNEYTLPVALDSSGALTRAHEVAATPTTILFRPDGAEATRRVGAVNADWIVRKVLPLSK